MKIFRQCIIIFGSWFMGEFLNKVLGVPLPGNVIGMVIILLLLLAGVVKLEQIKEVSNFLLDHLAFFFLPAGAGLIASYDKIKDNIGAFVFICTITTFIVMFISGHVVQLSKKIKTGSKKYRIHVE